MVTIPSAKAGAMAEAEMSARRTLDSQRRGEDL